MILWALLLSSAFAAEPTATPVATPAAPSTEASASVLSKAVVFTALEQAQPKQPLGGSFADGEKMLRAGDPENEANIVFNERGLTKIVVCGFACIPPGVDAKEMEGAKGPTVPATSDTVNEKTKGYNEAAMDFASRFNKQMVVRKHPVAHGPQVIHKELSVKELTLNGVTIGKSNLYNAVGRFGTNMFHQESKDGTSLFVVCWKGDDGTTLAFESGDGGGRDQTITAAKILGSGVDYDYASVCKASKKVSAKLELAGIKLGDASADLEKKFGAPSDRATERMMWHYSLESKKSTVTNDVEVAVPGEKVNSISVNRLVEH